MDTRAAKCLGAFHSPAFCCDACLASCDRGESLLARSRRLQTIADSAAQAPVRSDPFRQTFPGACPKLKARIPPFKTHRGNVTEEYPFCSEPVSDHEAVRSRVTRPTNTSAIPPTPTTTPAMPAHRTRFLGAELPPVRG